MICLLTNHIRLSFSIHRIYHFWSLRFWVEKIYDAIRGRILKEVGSPELESGAVNAALDLYDVIPFPCLFQISISSFSHTPLNSLHVVHCKAGMARIGLVISYILLYLELFPTAEESISYYNQKMCLNSAVSSRSSTTNSKIGSGIVCLTQYSIWIREIDHYSCAEPTCEEG
ncbi:unnamed protein product [Lactuca virosa]|uniref:Tyrosine specific protein phosphatases domain-containing protein n=1 Tax=Lactuca virosa TaxID=75947 RepID=A0AAU9PQQ0_9ASTR|nr:unnamed protein product [Lactuca virosa]